MSASGVQEYHESMGEDLQRAAVILVGVLTKGLLLPAMWSRKSGQSATCRLMNTWQCSV